MFSARTKLGPCPTNAGAERRDPRNAPERTSSGKSTILGHGGRTLLTMCWSLPPAKLPSPSQLGLSGFWVRRRLASGTGRPDRRRLGMAARPSRGDCIHGLVMHIDAVSQPDFRGGPMLRLRQGMLSHGWLAGNSNRVVFTMLRFISCSDPVPA